MKEVVGYVELTSKFNQEGNKWVGVCLELGTSTYAKTLERVRSDLHKLIVEHVNLLEEAGERERFFNEHNIVFHRAKPIPREIRIPSTDDDVVSSYFQPGVFEIRHPAPATS